MLISLAQSTLQPAPTLNPAPSWMKRLVEVEFNFPATTTNRYAVAPPSILDTLSGGNNPRSFFFLEEGPGGGARSRRPRQAGGEADQTPFQTLPPPQTLTDKRTADIPAFFP